MGNARIFTVLKFKTNKLFQVLPNEFDGEIEEVKDRESGSEKTVETKSEPVIKNPPMPDKTPVETETSQVPNQKTPTETKLNNTDTGTDPTNVTPFDTDTNYETDTATFAKSPATTETAPKLPEQPPVTGVTKPQLAIDFIEWCRQQIIDKTIVINESYGPIQKVSHGGVSVIAAVTPRIFAEYAQSIGMENPTDKATFTKIQSAIHQAKLNIVAPKGQIHVFKIKKSLNNPLNSNIKIRHYLFSLEDFCGDNEVLREIILAVENNTNLVKV